MHNDGKDGDRHRFKDSSEAPQVKVRGTR